MDTVKTYRIGIILFILMTTATAYNRNNSLVNETIKSDELVDRWTDTLVKTISQETDSFTKFTGQSIVFYLFFAIFILIIYVIKKAYDRKPR